jgi:hypothetical protein
MADSADQLIETLRLAGRVCPHMANWNALWEILPDRRRDIHEAWQPPLPLILGAWFTSTNAEKRERFEEHLRWAESHGALDRAALFLMELREEQWLTEPNRV